MPSNAYLITFRSLEKSSHFSYFLQHTANIFNVIFTLFTCVPLFTVISLYCLHLIAAQVAFKFNGILDLVKVGHWTVTTETIVTGRA